MNKPQRQLNLELLDRDWLQQKRKDILHCIKSCRKELLSQYNEQLDVVDELIEAKKQLVINFDRPPVDDTHDNSWE